ncbi:MAG: hypothetical protein N2376_03150 [Clostridia bacterium]|nr:hypothetical protein [Clostridia bacterium]
MISIKDTELLRVSEDFDRMLNAAIRKMKEDSLDEGEINLKLKIELRKDTIEEGEKTAPIFEPSFSHKIKSKLIHSGFFEGVVTEKLVIVGDEDMILIHKKDAQISMFEASEQD